MHGSSNLFLSKISNVMCYMRKKICMTGMNIEEVRKGYRCHIFFSGNIYSHRYGTNLRNRYKAFKK